MDEDAKHTERELREPLSQWYERPLATDSATCPDGPLFRDLVEHAQFRVALPPDQASHVDACPRCERTLQAIRRELAELDDAETRSERTAETACPAEPATPMLRKHVMAGRWGPATRKVAGLAAAACILLACWLVWNHTGAGPALAGDLREIGFARPIPFQGTPLDLSDPQVVSDTELQIENLRIELAQALSADRPTRPVWRPWTELYRNLQSLGQWEEARIEMERFAEHARRRDQRPNRYTMYYTALADLGALHAAMGDYETALVHYRSALGTARDHRKWFQRTGRFDDSLPHAAHKDLAGTLPSFLRKLSRLAAARGDQPSAWAYHDEGEELLADFFRGECAFRSLDVAPDASMLELCRAIVHDGDEGLESFASKVREQLLLRVMLHRVDRDIEAAQHTLDLAASLPVYPFADESRLDFNEPMERVRLAIARGDFGAALFHADDAQRNAGPRQFDGRPSHAPIGVIARAELLLLRGVARSGIDEDDQRALDMIESAIEAVQRSAGSLSGPLREQLSQRFSDWLTVADFMRRETHHDEESP